jgi:hypothetical protein
LLNRYFNKPIKVEPDYTTADVKKYGIAEIIVKGFIGIVILAAGISLFTDSKNSKTYSIPDKYDAYIMMEKFVKEKLKSPKTAEFEPISTITFKNEGNVWAFVGYVDSQNSFGALIRTNFSIGMRYYTDNENWGLTTLIFEDR